MLRTRTTGATDAGSGNTQRVQQANNTWAESALTWANRPAMETATIGTVPATSGPDTVTSATLDPAALRTRLGQHTTLAVTGKGADALSFSSRGNATASNRPQPVLTVS